MSDIKEDLTTESIEITETFKEELVKVSQKNKQNQPPAPPVPKTPVITNTWVKDDILNTKFQTALDTLKDTNKLTDTLIDNCYKVIYETVNNVLNLESSDVKHFLDALLLEVYVDSTTPIALFNPLRFFYGISKMTNINAITVTRFETLFQVFIELANPDTRVNTLKQISVKRLAEVLNNEKMVQNLQEYFNIK